MMNDHANRAFTPAARTSDCEATALRWPMPHGTCPADVRYNGRIHLPGSAPMPGSAVNYPDILGLITQGVRVNIGVVQAAVAVRPRTVRAGRPFEILLLLQNASDVDVDVVVTLGLPETDAKKQKGRFLTRSTRLVVGIAPAEVGYVVLPATTLADVAIGDDYRITLELDVKALGKPQRVRAPEGGGLVDRDVLRPAALETLDALTLLEWSAQKRLGRAVLDASFSVMMGRLGQLADFKAGWVSIARLSDYADHRPLLARYGDALIVDVLPHLKRASVFKPLLGETAARFKAAGYELHPAEAALIAKLLTLILEFAAPEETGHGFMAAGPYAVKPLVLDDPLRLQVSPTLPHWAIGLLTLLERDARTAQYPVQAVQRPLYEPLVRDAAAYAFSLIERDSGEDLGTEAEHAQHVEELVEALRAGRGLDFAHAYLPLVLGGVLVNDQIPAAKETPAELLVMAIAALGARRPEVPDELMPLYELAARLIDRTGQKYGYRI
jgi:hypothetical protein